MKKHAGPSPRGGGSPTHEDDRRRSGFRAAARIPAPSPALEDLADSDLDDDTQTNVNALPDSIVTSSEAVTTRHPKLDDEGEHDNDNDDDEGVPTIETRVDSAQMLALLAQAGLSSPFDAGEDLSLDGDTVADAGSDYDPYDDTSPTLPAPPKRPRGK